MEFEREKYGKYSSIHASIFGVTTKKVTNVSISINISVGKDGNPTVTHDYTPRENYEIISSRTHGSMFMRERLISYHGFLQEISDFGLFRI